MSWIASRWELVGQPHPGVDDVTGRLLTLVAAEDEVDRRQQVARSQQVDRLDPAWGVEHPLTAPPGRTLPVSSAPNGLSVDLRRIRVREPTDERGQEVQLVVGAITDEVVVVETHRAARLDHHRRRPTHRLDPGGQLVGVAHGRRQAHEAHLGRQVDDHLLPHRSAIGVLEEVDFVEDHETKVGECRATWRRSCCAAPRSSSRRSARRHRWRCRPSAGRPRRRRSGR